MKAITYKKYGPPDVLQPAEIEKPVPKRDEVLIRIQATSVTAGDWRMRKAEPFIVRFFNGLLRPKKMTILGMEFSGVIEQTGDKVTLFKKGDAVFGSSDFGTGAYVEYICLPEGGKLALKPDNLSHEEAAVVPVGGNTALYFLRDKGHIKRGDRVLINGASGSVGTYAVQLARHFGAEVTGVCSTGNVAMVRSLGAHKVIDYTKEDIVASGESYDLIFDAVGKLSRSEAKKMLVRNGALVSVNRGLAKSTRENLIFLKKLLESGTLKPVIDRHYALEQIHEAHRYAETGHKKGNVAVSIR